MAGSSGSNTEQIRAKAMEIGKRARSDPDFAQQLISDPQTTLVAAGLPEDAARDLVVEEGLGDVVGYADITCVFTCICSVVTLTVPLPGGRTPPGGR